MAKPAQKYPHVPSPKITSIDVVSFDAGLDQRGEANIKPNSFSVGRNVMVTPQGLAAHRYGLKRWLPDTVNTAGQAYPADYNGVIYFITADNGQIKYCQTGDTAWTLAGGDNTVTTANTTTTFLRILDKVLILNGADNLGYLDLSTMNVVHFNHVNDPSAAPTAAYVGTLATGSYKVYYCISYNSVAGKTIGSPILTQPVNKIREQWASNGSDGITITDANTRPAGAVSWNVYLATAPAGGTIQLTDMLPIALHLDINTTTFTDNGSITQMTDQGTAPTVNSTAGPKAKYGVEINGRPFLYGVTNDMYAVMIGGDGDNALDFTEGNGGYRLVLNQGTDYYPSAIIGFRNGQGVPSITVLYSSVSGLSKASIIDQNTVNLGQYSTTVWGSIDQNYGASGVASPYAVINYRGRLVFPSTDGITNIDTSSLRFNVLTATRVSDPVIDEVSTIKSNRLNQIVGTAWANRLMFAVPANGFDTNNKILVYDVTRTNGECWYTFDIAANWIGTVSPPNSPGFVYVAQGNHYFQLTEMYVAQDETSTGVTNAFPMELTTAVLGQNAAHTGYFALVQAVLYMRDFVGNVSLILNWRDRQSGNMVTKTKTFSAGTYAKSTVGNWSSPGYMFNQAISTTVLRWGENDLITDSQVSQKTNPRFRLRLNNVITNELQATVAYNPDNSGGIVRSISFEGESLGISPDV